MHWCRDSRFAWSVAYDHIGDRARTERDYDYLDRKPWPFGESPIVPVLQYDGGRACAADIVATMLDVVATFDEEEQEEYEELRQFAIPCGPIDRPAAAIGGLVPERYSRSATDWYLQLIDELDRATDQLDRGWCRVHLLGIGKPGWIHHAPHLITSYDSSGPARQASFGWPAIANAYREEFGLSIAKLKKSRAARLAYHIIAYRAAGGLPWSSIDEDLLEDDTGAHETHPAAWQQLPLIV